MKSNDVYRLVFILVSIAMVAIRVFFQSKVLREKREFDLKEGKLSIASGSAAALISLVFGLGYVFAPDFFSFAYILQYPDWIRTAGVLMLAGGITLLGSAHQSLGMSFHSLVGSKTEQVLVKSGPYHWIRHPIYSAYLLLYLGGGLTAGNWILTLFPVTLYAILVATRMGAEEELMQTIFGDVYSEYQEHTGKLLPKLNK